MSWGRQLSTTSAHCRCGTKTAVSATGDLATHETPDGATCTERVERERVISGDDPQLDICERCELYVCACRRGLNV